MRRPIVYILPLALLILFVFSFLDNSHRTSSANGMALRPRYVREPLISPYDDLMRSVCREEGCDWRFMSAIAYHESRFTPDLVSPRGATGLMQIMPAVARRFGVSSADSLADPETNIRLAYRVLASIYESLALPASTPRSDRMGLLLASYNGGIGHVSDARRLARMYGENPNSWEVVARYLELKADSTYYGAEGIVSGRFTGAAETRAFVDHVLRRYDKYRKIAEE